MYFLFSHHNIKKVKKIKNVVPFYIFYKMFGYTNGPKRSSPEAKKNWKGKYLRVNVWNEIDGKGFHFISRPRNLVVWNSYDKSSQEKLIFIRKFLRQEIRSLKKWKYNLKLFSYNYVYLCYFNYLPIWFCSSLNIQILSPSCVLEVVEFHGVAGEIQ